VYLFPSSPLFDLFFAKLSSFPFTQKVIHVTLKKIMNREIVTRNFSCNQTKGIVTPVTCTVHEDSQTRPVLYSVLPVRYTQLQVSWYGTVCIAVVGTVRPLLGSRRNCQAILYLFQKRLPNWQYAVYGSVLLRYFNYWLSFTLLFVRIF